MKAIVLEEPFKLNMREMDVPQTAEGYAKLRVIAVSVCGSDIHSYKGNSLLLTYPRVLGHEFCAYVEELHGEANGIKVGDRVCVLPYISCGECRPCRLGRENCCTSLKVLGVHVDGAMAEYVTVPISTLIKLPDEIKSKVAALIEPLSVSAHAVRRGGISKGDKVLVLGGGPIGLGAAESARSLGADVRIADVVPVRRKFVEERFGFETMDPSSADIDGALRDWTSGEYPNKVIDSTGNKASNATAINYLSAAGDLIFVGLQSGTLDISDPAFHIREANVYASRVAQMEDFMRVIDGIRFGSLRAERMITDVSDFKDSKGSFEKWVERGGDVFKGVIEMK